MLVRLQMGMWWLCLTKCTFTFTFLFYYNWEIYQKLKEFRAYRNLKSEILTTKGWKVNARNVTNIWLYLKNSHILGYILIICDW